MKRRVIITAGVNLETVLTLTRSLNNVDTTLFPRSMYIVALETPQRVHGVKATLYQRQNNVMVLYPH